ncbi:ribonuclease H-like domain-containing protein [Mycena pura]|uniref:ribonuclease H n=1 Tax=Mycena pura TaxID=153505 RepID=A0AAD6YRJ5_9AGAR|nr:ribonuclease H-like domain-containing protein [Mycena pura]
MANALPGSTVSTDHLGTTVTLPRTFEPCPCLSDKSPANIVAASSPLSHIFFSTFRDPHTKILDKRTVLVCIDGACAGNGTPAARAGVGVFFGPESPHNVSAAIAGPQTSQRAEILAATGALRKAHALFQEDTSVGSVVLLCDSQYVVGAMTEWIFAWKDRGWRNAHGEPVENQADFRELEKVIEDLEEDGLDVKFWLVGREHNAQADRLAKAACS